MKIETTLNMQKVIYNKIARVAKKNGLSCTQIILYLAEKVINEVSKSEPKKRSVQYQDSMDIDEWHLFHIRLEQNEYEYLLDLRKIMKKSVSFIIAYAVRKYMKKLFNKNNNYYNYYMFIKEIINNVVSWRVFWGNPHNGKYSLNTT